MAKAYRPVEALRRVLEEAGAGRVLVAYPANYRRIRRIGLQAVAVDILVYEYVLCRLPEARPCRPLRADDGLEICAPSSKGDEEAEVAVAEPRACGRVIAEWRDLASLLPSPPLPLYTIDLSYLDIHTEDELASLRVQLSASLAVVREWLWDPHLALVGEEPERIESLLEGMVGRHKMTLSRDKPGRLLWAMGADRVVILRPDAPEPLTDAEVRAAQAFLIGGIVDRIPRPGVSRSLDAKVPWGVPRRIELRGSLVGVPHRLNRIIEILLKARFGGMRLEEAILSSMTKRDRVLRAMTEVMRLTRGGRRPAGPWLAERLSWLRLSCEELRLALRKARVPVEGDPCGEG